MLASARWRGVAVQLPLRVNAGALKGESASSGTQLLHNNMKYLGAVARAGDTAAASTMTAVHTALESIVRCLEVELVLFTNTLVVVFGANKIFFLEEPKKDQLEQEARGSCIPYGGMAVHGVDGPEYGTASAAAAPPFPHASSRSAAVV